MVMGFSSSPEVMISPSTARSGPPRYWTEASVAYGDSDASTTDTHYQCLQFHHIKGCPLVDFTVHLVSDPCTTPRRNTLIGFSRLPCGQRTCDLSESRLLECVSILGASPFSSPR